MNTAVITVKTDLKTKKEAQKIAGDLGLSLSGILNSLVKQLVRTKRLEINLEDKSLQPTPFLIKALKESEADRKNGRIYSFNNDKNAVGFLNNIIKEK